MKQGSDVWEIRAGGWSARETREARLALLLLMVEPAKGDPLRMDNAGRLARDMPCSRQAASETIRRLRSAGFVTEGGFVIDSVARPELGRRRPA